MNFDIETIVKSLLVKERHVISENRYLEGVCDILDSIGDAHPELVYSLFKLREAIEEKL